MSKALTVQELDEKLTAAGHDPECAAYEPGNACSGPPVCHGETVDLPVARHMRVAPAAQPADVQALTGEQAITHRRMRSAASRVKAAQTEVQAATAEFQAALAAHLEACER